MIRVRNLSKKFGRNTVLDDVGFSVRAGTVTAVLGPNASGKSTLIKSILGLVRPDSGQIWIGDELVNGKWAYRSHIGYMPQISRFPDNLRVRELVQMVVDIRGAGNAVDRELFEEYHLAEFMDHSVRVLSGGTRQKINAALAFMFAPEILIFDEATAGLDPIAISILKGKIAREKRHGRTILVTTHNMQEVDEIADRILLLLDGRVHFDGSVLALKHDTGQESIEDAIISLIKDNEHGADAQSSTIRV